MIGIIPVAGAGINLRPHTYTQPKSLIPVAGKPILAYILDEMIEAGIKDFVFVIGYLGEKIQKFVGKYYPHINAKYVIQTQREGLGQAIYLTHTVIDPGNEVLIFLGDTIIETDIKKLIEDDYSQLCIRKVNDPSRFGVAEFDEDGFIKKVVEKPSIPKSNLALVGLYKIKEFDVLLKALGDNIEKNYRTRNEFHLTDGLMQMIKQGVKFKGHKVDNWYDCGQKEILLEINALLLKRNYNDEVKNHPGLKNSIIVEPVYIGNDATISNSIIGPNVTIGNTARISNSIVENSIIGSYTKLYEMVLANSIIGSDSQVIGKGRALNIGDNTELDLS